MKFKAFEAKNGLNINHRKESKFSKEFTVLVNGRNYDGKPCLHELIQLRIYWTDSRAYACIWIHGGKNKFYASGSGFAGGYGYHKESAATEEALTSAGIVIDYRDSISGRGESAMESALMAIARKLGYRKAHICKAHG